MSLSVIGIKLVCIITEQIRNTSTHLTFTKCIFL